MTGGRGSGPLEGAGLSKAPEPGGTEPTHHGGAGPEVVRAVAEHLRVRAGGLRPDVLLVLGSGLGRVAERVGEPQVVPFAEIPGMPRPTVPGHEGRFVLGRLGGVPVMVQSGRFHAYEGHLPGVLGLTVRAAAALGVSTVIVTNAAGAVRADLRPGDLVLIEDHINLTGLSPLVGAPRPGEARFPDMSAPYDPALRDLARAVAEERGIGLRSGVYTAMLGPAYETAAEVRMVGRLGGDLVGMSTVPEVLTARALGLRCLGFSMVTNLGTGLSADPVTHDEVLEVGRDAGRRLADLLVACLERMAQGPDGQGRARDAEGAAGEAGQSRGAK